MANYNGYVYNGSLALRQSTSTGSTRLQTIPDGTALVLATCSANDWFQTSYNGSTGYVVARYIAITNDGGICQVDDSGTLNIRQTPSTSATRVCRAAAGSQLRLLDNTSVPGWYRVSCSEGTGWAVSDYLIVVTAPDTSTDGDSGDSGSADTTTLRLGDESDAVWEMQQKLAAKNYYFGHSDGLFDTRTEWAVKYFQSRNNLTVDGIVGPETMATLNSTSSVIGIHASVQLREIGDPAEPEIKMNNPLWANVAFDADETSTAETIGSSGNAPTAIAITFTTLWEHAITPPVIATWAKNAGLRDEQGVTGVEDEFFTRVSSEWDVRYAGEATSFTDMENYLAKGGLLVVRLTNDGTNAYTTGATYVVVYKIDSDYVYLVNSNAGSNDPIPVATWKSASWVHEAHKYGVAED